MLIYASAFVSYTCFMTFCSVRKLAGICCIPMRNICLIFSKAALESFIWIAGDFYLDHTYGRVVPVKEMGEFSLVLDCLLGLHFSVSEVMNNEDLPQTTETIRCGGEHFREGVREAGIVLPSEVNAESNIIL